MGPLAPLALAAQAAGPILGGLQAKQAGDAQQAQAEINAKAARTRAAQVDTQARRGLESELGEIRAALGANEQRANVGTLAYTDDLRKESNRTRRIQVGNENQAADDYRTAGRVAASNGRMGLLSGIARSGPSLFNFYNSVR